MRGRIANRRNDFQHKLSATYARKYDVIIAEDLQMQNMVKNHHLVCTIMDSGWKGFLKKNRIQM